MAERRIIGRALRATPPADLDAQLLASTGCSVAEVRRMLADRPTPDLVARALAPFLAAEAPIGEIAVDVAGNAAAAVLDLYPAPAAAETDDGE